MGKLRGGGHTAVGQHALVDLGDVLVVKEEVCREVHHRLCRRHLAHFALGLAHSLTQHLGEQVKAHLLEVAVLLGAHQRSRTADLQVAHGDAHAASQILILVDSGQALGGLLGQRALAREQEVGEGLGAPAANAALELVELSQTQPLGVLDDEGVGMRVVDTALNDGGGHQDVDVVSLEALHDVFHLARAHLPMGHADASLRRRLTHAFHRLIDGGHTIRHVVHLTAAACLGTNGIAHYIGIVLPHVHLHRQAAFGRRHDEAHVAHAREAHLQRARDGRSREREHVHLLAQILELLFVLHAKALLLVHDDQAQIVGVHVARQQPMGADKHICLAFGKLLQGLLLLGGSPEAGKHRHLDAEGREAFLEGLVVLLGQDGGGA